MADMHVITGTHDRWKIVMHFTSPSGNNAVGVSWVNAYVNSRTLATALPDGDGTEGTIDATEKTSVLDGSLVEHTASFLLETGGTTTAQLRATLRNFYTAEKARVFNNLKQELRYFGHTESEA